METVSSVKCNADQLAISDDILVFYVASAIIGREVLLVFCL